MAHTGSKRTARQRREFPGNFPAAYRDVQKLHGSLPTRGDGDGLLQSQLLSGLKVWNKKI